MTISVQVSFNYRRLTPVHSSVASLQRYRQHWLQHILTFVFIYASSTENEVIFCRRAYLVLQQAHCEISQSHTMNFQ